MSLASLSPEAQLLLLTAGGEKNDPAIKALLARPLDWAKLSWLAEQERATPVLWRRVSASAPLPEEAQALHRLSNGLRVSHVASGDAPALGARHARGGRDQCRTIERRGAGAHGVWLVRGAANVDVDLLVRREDAIRARDGLMAAGWTASTANTAEFYEGHHHLPPLVDGMGTKVTLELHTSLFFEGHPFALTSNDIRSRAERVTVHGRTVLVPSVHDQLLHLCLHFAWSHMMATGAWRAFRDLDALLRTERVDWKEFTKLAKETRGASACYWTFRLARTLAGVQVPTWVERTLAPPEPEFALRRLEQHFTYDLLPTESISPSLWLTYTMWRAGLMPRWSGHGRVRPWDRADELLAAERPGRAKRLLLHLKNAKSWTRYARLVLLGP